MFNLMNKTDQSCADTQPGYLLTSHAEMTLQVTVSFENLFLFFSL